MTKLSLDLAAFDLSPAGDLCFAYRSLGNGLVSEEIDLRARARRALPAPIAVRAARIAGPAIAAGALITTVAVTAWPSSTSSLGAGPATVTSPTVAPASASASKGTIAASADAERAVQADRGTRDLARASLSEAAEKAAAAKAEKAKEAKEAKEAAKKAKEEAAKKKAKEEAEQEAKEAAAKKKAAELDLTVVGSRYTTAALKIRTEPSKDAKAVDVADPAKKLKVTDTVRKGYRLVVVDDKGRWVTEEYLSKKKPSAETAAGISDASCSKSSGIESGLVPNGVKVYRAICAAFPQVSSFGGRRSSNDYHGSGQAVDNMISDTSAGWRLAKWLRANASELGVREVIYSRQIWTVQRSGEGWRGMSDRGSVSANHLDHVHVTVY